MLGFPKDTTVKANTWTNSPSNVDVNLSLRYVTVECSSVDAGHPSRHHRAEPKFFGDSLPRSHQRSGGSERGPQPLRVYRWHERGQKSGPKGNVRVVSRINYEELRNPCRAGTKGCFPLSRFSHARVRT